MQIKERNNNIATKTANYKKILVKMNMDLVKTVKSKKSPSCSRPWTTIEERDESNSVAPCCWIDFSYKDSIKNQDEIMDIWKSEKVVNARTYLLNNQSPVICRPECPVISYRKNWFNKLEFTHFTEEELDNFSIRFLENRKTVLSAIIEGKTESAFHPLRIKVFPSNKCNLRCIMCFNDFSHTYTKKWYFDGLLDELAVYLEELLVYGAEPFSCDISKRLIFNDRFPNNVHITFLTNGTLLSENIIEKLASVRMHHAAISLDSCSPQIYERIRKPANFSETIKNIKNLVKLRNNHPIRHFGIYACFVIQEFNYHEIPDFVDFCSQLELIPDFTYIWENENARRRAQQHNNELGRFPENMIKLFKSLDNGLQRAEETGNSAIITNV